MASLYQAPLAFLRPRAIPRPSTIARFIGTTQASTSSPPSTPASKAPSSRHPTAQGPPANATPSDSKPYRVSLTASESFPVYHMTQAGGNKKLTRVKHVLGDINAFKADLQEFLAVPDNEKEVTISQLTRHVVIKGHRKKEISDFLLEHGAWCKENHELL